MAWQVDQLPAATSIYDADIFIVNNLGVTRSVTVAQMRLTFQGAGFTLNNASPNNVVPTFQSLAANAVGAAGYTNIDVVLATKGSGAFMTQLPDNTLIGGQKRGTNSVDLQTIRSNAAQVAAGATSVITGGTSNTISASCSQGFIGGGSTNAQTTSGQGNVIVGGQNNSINSGNGAFIGGGTSNTMSSSTSSAVIAGGTTNNITGAVGAVIGGGQNNSISGQYSVTPGGQYGTDRGDYNAYVYSSGRTSVQGDAQSRKMILRRTTADATQSSLFSDGGTVYNLNTPTLPNNSAFRFTAEVVARSNATGDAGAYTVTGLIKRGANAASTAIVGAVTVVTVAEDAGAAAWDVTAQANTTNGSILIRVTGAAATSIKWVAKIEMVEVVG